MDTGALVSPGPGSGSCKQIPGLWRGGGVRRGWGGGVGAGGGFPLMYLEGSWGIKAPPTPAALCVIFGGCLGESRGKGRCEGPGG